MENVSYQVEPDLTAEAFRGLLIDSGLGVRRPVENLERLEGMLRPGSLIVTARCGGDLVGVARSLTDRVYCCYLSDLAVAKRAQGQGIGRGLIEATRLHLGPSVSVILLAAPEAVGFYESIGMPRQPDCFWYRRSV